MTAPIETKVAATGAAGTAVLVTFGMIGWLDPSFTNPPAYVTAGLVTLVGAVVGWLAPHTNRTPQALTGDLTIERNPQGALAWTTSGAAAGPPTPGSSAPTSQIGQ